MSPTDSQTSSDDTTIAPLARHGQLEVDAFCARCHYNLHGQLVWIDERLNFPICRCPECGQHHPAGSGVTAHSIWLRRFASMLISLWIVLVLAVAFAACLAFAGVQNIHVDLYTFWGSTHNGQTMVSQHTLQPPAGYRAENLPGNGALAIVCLVSVLLGFFVGALLVSVLWHWPRRRYVLTAFLPLVSATFVIISFYNDVTYETIFPWCRDRILFQAALQCLGIAIGVLLGRKLARQIVRMIIPSKPRQLLAFLWRADGKPMPAN